MATAGAAAALGHSGAPGTRWRNHTDLVWWQWICAMRNPCPECIRRDGRLFPGPDPPAKLHPHCECTFLPVMPGHSAPITFEPVPERVANLPAGDRRKIVGELNAALLAAGLATMYDLFAGDGRPRSFEAVVKRKQLTLDQLLAAGITEGWARRALSGE